MKHLKLFENSSKYEKQNAGKYIEIYDDNGNLVAEFEYFDSGVFVGWEYPTDDEKVEDLQDSFSLTGEIRPEDLNGMLGALKEEYPFLKIVGYDNFKREFEF